MQRRSRRLQLECSCVILYGTAVVLSRYGLCVLSGECLSQIRMPIVMTHPRVNMIEIKVEMYNDMPKIQSCIDPSSKN